MKNKTDRNPKAEQAQELIESHRGHHILSQALLLAIDSMNRRPQVGSGDGQIEREPSTLADMKLLYTQIFNMYSPAPMIPTVGATLRDIEGANEIAQKQLADTLNGTYCKSHYLIDNLMAEATESNVLSTNLENENYWQNYIYLETDKEGYDYFRHKDGSIVKNLIRSGKTYDEVELTPENVINLDNFRSAKDD
jgi:hypothetical protein